MDSDTIRDMRYAQKRKTAPHKKALLFCAVLFFFILAHTAHASITSGLVGRWTFDSKYMSPDVRDTSGQGNHGQLGGFTSTTTVPGMLRQALTFDGTNDYAQVASSPILGTDTSITIAFWLKGGASSWSTAFQNSLFVESNGGGAGSSENYIAIDGSQNLTGTPGKIYFDQFAPAGITLQSNTALSLNKWYHVAVVRDGSSQGIYIDGVLDASNSNAETFSGSTPNAVTIGGWPAADRYFKGDIDDMRLYNRALSAAEVRELYVFRERAKINTPISTPNLNSGKIGHWTFDGKDMNPNVRDISSSANHGTLSGFTSTTTRPGKVGQALSFDGSDDYVDMGTTAVLNPSSAMTISAWVYPRSGGAALYSIATRNTNGGTRAYEFYLRPGSSNQPEFYINGTLRVTGPALSNNTWTHLVVTFNASQSVLYVNGRQYVTGTTATMNSVVDQTMIGGRDDTTFEFKGYLDDVRMYNRALSAADVKLLYAATSPGKVNATLPMPTVGKGGLVGHWTFDGKNMYPNVRDISGSANHGTLSGFTSTTTRPGKAGQALSFDGSNQYVNMGLTNIPNPNQPQTLSVWVNIGSLATTPQSFLTLAQMGSAANQLAFRSSTLQVTRAGGGTTIDSGVSPVANKWYLMTYTYDGTNSKVYIDGIVRASNTTAPQSGTRDLLIVSGYNTTSGERLVGKIDDVRVYNKALTALEVKQLYNSARATMR